MKTARETAAISLTKPLTPCHAQQVVGGGDGAGPIRTGLGDAGEPRVLQKPSLFRAHSGDHGTCLREVSPGTKEMLGGDVTGASPSCLMSLVNARYEAKPSRVSEGWWVKAGKGREREK